MDSNRTKLERNLLLAGGSLPLVALSDKLAKRKAEKQAKEQAKKERELLLHGGRAVA